MKPFLDSLREEVAESETYAELLRIFKELHVSIADFEHLKDNAQKQWDKGRYSTAADLLQFIEIDQVVSGLARQSSDLVRLTDHSFKLITRLIELCEKELNEWTYDSPQTAERRLGQWRDSSSIQRHSQ